jgi:signal transduction histidine kinase
LISDVEVKEATDVIYHALGTGASGRDDPVALVDDVNGQPLAAAPVLSRDGRLVGVIYARLPHPPFFNILRNIPRVLTYSFLPVLAMSAIVGLVFGLLAGRNLSGRLNRLTAASAGLARGDLTRRVVDCSVDELGQLGRQFNAMADQLAENLRSLRRLAEQNAQLAEQATQLATVEERNRLARDLHDSVSQELFSLTMLAAASQRQLQRNPQLVSTQLSEIQEMATRALHETRSLIFALRPAMLDGRGLGPALRELVQAMKDRQGLHVELAISGERRLPLDHEQALFRIVQEALANVARHSGVRTACIALRYENNYTYLEINDGGRGFDTRQPRNSRSLGLDSMAERASALRGTFTVDSRLNEGTTIAVTLPVA